MSTEKVQHSEEFQKLNNINLVKSQPELNEQSFQNQQIEQNEYKNHQQQAFLRSQSKNQNPKIGRPAKTDQQQQFKKCYLQNKQKFELECQLLVFIHQNYFDEIIDNPINARVSKQLMDRLFIAYNLQNVYRTLLKLNQSYFKNSLHYPEEKLKYTSLIDVAYMIKTVRLEHGDKFSSIQLLLIIFFYLYNEKLINQTFYEYFVQNLMKFREGIVFGPGKPKLEKLDKLIICLALTLADLEKVYIEQEIIYSDQDCSQQEEQENQNQELGQEQDDYNVKIASSNKVQLNNKRCQPFSAKSRGNLPTKKIHRDQTQL